MAHMVAARVTSQAVKGVNMLSGGRCAANRAGGEAAYDSGGEDKRPAEGNSSLL